MNDCGFVAQVVEHLPFKQGVQGSSPCGPTFLAPSSSGLGHLVFIQKIAGSSPAGVTKKEVEFLFGGALTAPPPRGQRSKGEIQRRRQASQRKE